MQNIKIDTDMMKSYASRIEKVNNRLAALDIRLKKLYLTCNVIDLYNTGKADGQIGWSLHLQKCQNYLNVIADDFESKERYLAKQNPMNFSKKSYQHNNLYYISKTKEEAGKVIKKTGDAISSIIYNLSYDYYSQGTTYKVIEYEKCQIKEFVSMFSFAGSVTKIILTGKFKEIPKVISSGNKILSLEMDSQNILDEKYGAEKSNFSKEAGGVIGEALGNRKVGENIGEKIVQGADFTSNVIDFSETMGAVTQFDFKHVDLSQLKNEIKSIDKLQINMVDLLSSSPDDIKYQAKLASYTYKNTANLISNSSESIKSLYNVGTKTYDTIESGIKLVTGEKTSSAVDDYIYGFEDKINTFNDIKNFSKNVKKESLIKDLSGAKYVLKDPNYNKVKDSLNITTNLYNMVTK